MGWGLRRLRVEVLGVEDEGITSHGVRLAPFSLNSKPYDPISPHPVRAGPGGGARPQLSPSRSLPVPRLSLLQLLLSLRAGHLRQERMSLLRAKAILPPARQRSTVEAPVRLHSQDISRCFQSTVRSTETGQPTSLTSITGHTVQPKFQELNPPPRCSLLLQLFGTMF